MGQTFGSQILGPWYDIIGFVIGSAVFFYLAAKSDDKPQPPMDKMPEFLRNKKLCISMGILMAFLAAVRIQEWM